MKMLNLAVAFFLELCLLAAVGYWGWQTSTGIVQIVLVIGVPLAIAVFWGYFLAPRAVRPLPYPQVVFAKGAVLGIGVLALLAVQQPVLAVIFAVAIVVNLSLAVVWKQFQPNVEK